MFRDYRTLQTQALEENRASLMAALVKLGITSAYVTYSGGGDSGDVTDAGAQPAEAVEAFNSEKIAVLQPVGAYEGDQYVYHLIQVEETVADALARFCMEWTDEHHPGWDNNDGASGTMTVDVAEDTFSLEHESYYTESYRDNYSR